MIFKEAVTGCAGEAWGGKQLRNGRSSNEWWNEKIRKRKGKHMDVSYRTHLKISETGEGPITL